MSSPPLILAGVILPVRSRLDFQQSYEPVGGRFRRRMASGTAFSMTRWERWRTTINGAGWLPAPLLSIDFRVPYEIHCIEPVSLAPDADLPPGWRARTDFELPPQHDGHGGEVRLIYPILKVCSDRPRFSTGINPSWELICEEV